jgi:polyhydroxyalkanoate synthesis regulator protein
MTDPTSTTAAEQLFDKALDVAEKHLEEAMKEGGALSSYVAIAMIEAAVNQAVEETSHEDVADMLRDLADQIEADAEEGEED